MISFKRFHCYRKSCELTCKPAPLVSNPTRASIAGLHCSMIRSWRIH